MFFKKCNFLLLSIFNFWIFWVVMFFFNLFFYSLVFLMIGFYDLFVITLNIFKGDASIQEVFRLLSVFTLIYITVFIIKHKNRLEFKFEAYCRLIRLKDYNLRNNNDYIKFKMVISILLIYLSICLVGFSFYLSMGQKFDGNSVSNIINIFIWATYLLAPIVVIWVYIDWKTPKQYELEKEYAEKILENLTDVYHLVFERAVTLKFLENIGDYAILINKEVLEKNTYSNSYFYKAHTFFDLLNSISKIKMNKKLLDNLERITQLVDGQSKHILERYNIYYRDFSEELKSKKTGTNCTSYDNIVLTKEQLFAKIQIKWYLEDKLESEVIEENGTVIKFEYTFKEHIDILKKEYEKISSELIKYIKVEN